MPYRKQRDRPFPPRVFRKIRYRPLSSRFSFLFVLPCSDARHPAILPQPFLRHPVSPGKASIRLAAILPLSRSHPPPARRSSSFRRRAEPQSRRPSTSPRPVGRPRLRGRLPPSSPVPRPSFPPSFPSSAGPGSVAAPPVPPEGAQGRFRHAVPPSAPRRRRRRAGTDLRSARSLVAHALFSGLSALRSADTGLHFDLRA